MLKYWLTLSLLKSWIFSHLIEPNRLYYKHSIVSPKPSNNISLYLNLKIRPFNDHYF